MSSILDLLTLDLTKLPDKSFTRVGRDAADDDFGDLYRAELDHLELGIFNVLEIELSDSDDMMPPFKTCTFRNVSKHAIDPAQISALVAELTRTYGTDENGKADLDQSDLEAIAAGLWYGRSWTNPKEYSPPVLFGLGPDGFSLFIFGVQWV